MTPHIRRREGPVYDRSMHYVVEGGLPAWCDWLDVEVDGEPDLLSPGFSSESRTADLLVRVGRGRLLHAEYIKQVRPNMFARMVDYRAKIMLRYQGMSLTQVAVVMGKGRLREYNDPDNGFQLGLRTIYLPEVDPREFLKRPPIAALAELAGPQDPSTRAQSVVEAIGAIRTLPPDRHRGLLEAMINLATINLDPYIIDLIRRESRMSARAGAKRISGTELGKELIDMGLERGRREGFIDGVIALLNSRFGEDVRNPEIARRLFRKHALDAVRVVQTAESRDSLMADLGH